MSQTGYSKIPVRSFKKPNRVCENCKCLGSCNSVCKAARKPINKVCTMCKCTGICNEECEKRKQLYIKKQNDAKQGSKVLQNSKVCKTCNCTGECNSECKLAQQNALLGKKTTDSKSPKLSPVQSNVPKESPEVDTTVPEKTSAEQITTETSQEVPKESTEAVTSVQNEFNEAVTTVESPEMPETQAIDSEEPPELQTEPDESAETEPTVPDESSKVPALPIIPEETSDMQTTVKPPETLVGEEDKLSGNIQVETKKDTTNEEICNDCVCDGECTTKCEEMRLQKVCDVCICTEVCTEPCLAEKNKISSKKNLSDNQAAKDKTNEENQDAVVEDFLDKNKISSKNNLFDNEDVKDKTNDENQDAVVADFTDKEILPDDKMSDNDEQILEDDESKVKDKDDNIADQEKASQNENELQASDENIKGETCDGCSAGGDEENKSIEETQVNVEKVDAESKETANKTEFTDKENTPLTAYTQQLETTLVTKQFADNQQTDIIPAIGKENPLLSADIQQAEIVAATDKEKPLIPTDNYQTDMTSATIKEKPLLPADIQQAEITLASDKKKPLQPADTQQAKTTLVTDKKKPLLADSQQANVMVSTDKIKTTSKACQCKFNLDTAKKDNNLQTKNKVKDPTSEICEICNCNIRYKCPIECQQKKNKAKRTSCNLKNKADINQRDSYIAELNNVIKDIQCSCDHAEALTEPFTKQASQFQASPNDMEYALKMMLSKCKMKDRFIQAMLSELKVRASSKIFDGFLNNIANNKACVPDYDRSLIAKSLPRPQKCDECGTNDNEPTIQIIDILRLASTSILVKWTPCNNTNITGYEVLVDGKVVNRVCTNRNTAVVDCLDLSYTITINVYPMHKNNRIGPGAVAIYSI